MHRLSRLAVSTVAAAAAAVSIAAPSASATYPAPDGGSPNAIQRVEVPIDDTTSEAVQVIIALALGAAAATLAHRRRGRATDPDDPLNGLRPVAVADTQFGTTDVLSR